jgi:hypothetical protein
MILSYVHRRPGYACFMRPLLWALPVLLLAPIARAKDHSHPLKELEERAKKDLAKGKDGAKRFDAFMKYLGVAATCPAADCKEIASTKWVTANLDADVEDEHVLAITTVGSGPCPAVHFTAIVFDSVPNGFTAVAHRTLRLSGAAKPIAEVTAAHVHSAAAKDLVFRIDGECPDGAREHEVHVASLESGKLVELVDSTQFSKELTAHKIVGSPPAAIELVGAKKIKLLFDEASAAYDPLPPYDVAIKNNVAKEDDTTLSLKECAAPLSTTAVSECGLSGSAKVQVVVQNGKAIGLTVSSTPSSPTFVRCLRKELAAATWKSAPGAIGCTKTFTIK